MITRPEAKAIADAVISPERRQVIHDQLDGLIRDSAGRGEYGVDAAWRVQEYTEEEKSYAQNLLQNAPNLFTVDFTGGQGAPHPISWE